MIMPKSMFRVQFIIVALLAFCCEVSTDRQARFQLMDTRDTGIDFENNLTFDKKFNVYTYRNYYNGGGVSIGDINNDGLVDLYFTANQSANRLYLNKGNFQFEDITEKAGVGGQKAWSTGVTMADINGDGWLDIYVCNSGDIEGDNKQNELFINNQDLTFREAAREYGLDDRGFSTHASFFDFDKDGDLDVYLLNNSYQAIGSFNLRSNERPKRDSLGGDKLLLNEGNYFEDVSERAGIYGSVIGFGLGVTVGDVNGDGWEDIYVSNDFFERDYLYVNQQDATFKETLTSSMKSISGASMGADMADINNDGYNDLFVTEMLPRSNERLKSVTTFEDWTRYQYNVSNGYHHQYTRNTFQLNNGNNSFSEIGRLAGVEASDWSWGALIFDMDNDGNKDLFIANGIYKDLTDQDYLQYISNEEVVKSIVTDNEVDYAKLIEIIPSNKISNLAFLNQGGLQFAEMTQELGLAEPSFSNGAAYGDLDNDGDLDLIVNNVNMPSFVYKNMTREKSEGNFIQLELKGSGENVFGIGARIKVTDQNTSYYVEQQPTRGFQSSVDFRPTIGLRGNSNVDIVVHWPTGNISRMTDVPVNQKIVIQESENKDPLSSTAGSGESQPIFKQRNDFVYHHVESDFVDFDRDRLLYHMKSTEGPRIAAADLNADGVDDFYVGGAKGISGTLFISDGDTFKQVPQPSFENDKISEDAESLFFDADGDGDLDLYVCSGGNEFPSSSSALADRLYFNDGRNLFTRSDQTLPSDNYVSTSTVTASDFDHDGDLDLFVGERLKPFSYGVAGDGYLLQNDGQGNFVNVAADKAPSFEKLGLITDAEYIDLDGNQETVELVVVGEFMAPRIFQYSVEKFEDITPASISKLKGWWNVIKSADLDGDGNVDLILGNHGLNSRFKASEAQPIKLYVDDFDQNGFVDPILTTTGSDGKSYPFALRHNLIDQMKNLKKKFPNYESYKHATIEDVLDQQQLKNASVLETTFLETIILKNVGNLNFEVTKLPVDCSLAPVFAIAAEDFDKDGDLDLILGGNLYGTKPEIGRYDASYGTFLSNIGGMDFISNGIRSGFVVDGEVRDFIIYDKAVFVFRNSDSVVTFQY